MKINPLIRPMLGGPNERVKRSDIEWRQDVCGHINRMRAMLVEDAHIAFHRETQTGPQIIFLFGNPYRNQFVKDLTKLPDHFGFVGWFWNWPGMLLAAKVVNTYVNKHVYDWVERYLEKHGACPGIHEEAESGIDDIEKFLAGES